MHGQPAPRFSAARFADLRASRKVRLTPQAALTAAGTITLLAAGGLALHHVIITLTRYGAGTAAAKAVETVAEFLVAERVIDLFLRQPGQNSSI